MKQFTNLINNLKHFREQRLVWLIYPILSLVFLSIVVGVVYKSAEFLLYEINRSFATEEQLESSLLRLDMENFEKMSRKLHLEKNE